MSTLYADNNPIQSLVERKKLQWARERQELAGFNSENGLWGSSETMRLFDKPHLRTRHAGRHGKDHILDQIRRDSRRQSLPPLLHTHQGLARLSDEKPDKEMGGETSGYGSDNPNQTPEHLRQAAWQNHTGYESSSSGRDDRPKWGDRGVAHVSSTFWQPKELVTSLTKNNDTPGWLKRGLEGETAVLVSNTSPAESPDQDYGDRPGTASTTSQNRSHIRGQNVPVEPTELAEREKRRQIAVAHQEAVRQQLEDRERRRQEEKARRIREEYEEELRIAREQEIERKRRDQEQRLREDRLQNELKRKAALEEAIEIAEREARQVKMKQRLMRHNIVENVLEIDKNKPVGVVEERQSEEQCVSENFSDNNVARSDTNDSVNNNDSFNNNLNKNSVTVNLNNNQLSQENLALVLQNPLESLQNVQFALLIPTSNNAAKALPIAVPLTTDRSSVVNTARTENRILTPTQYRNKRLCDSSTQTEPQEDPREKYVREKLANLEINFRKERRSRSEFREHVEDRPKWGVNRPPTRYIKQSEKDLLYQRRKMRQKKVNDKTNSYYGHSSDDSQAGSPRSYRRKGYGEKRHGRSLWRKNEHLFAENVRVYQTEIVPLESDKDHIYFKSKQPHYCCCMYRKEKDKYCEQAKVVDILKIEHNSPRECSNYNNNNDDKLPEFNNTSIDESSDVLDKLSSLHNGLKQEHWDETLNHYHANNNRHS